MDRPVTPHERKYYIHIALQSARPHCFRDLSIELKSSYYVCFSSILSRNKPQNKSLGPHINRPSQQGVYRDILHDITSAQKTINNQHIGPRSNYVCYVGDVTIGLVMHYGTK